MSWNVLELMLFGGVLENVLEKMNKSVHLSWNVLENCQFLSWSALEN